MVFAAPLCGCPFCSRKETAGGFQMGCFGASLCGTDKSRGFASDFCVACLTYAAALFSDRRTWIGLYSSPNQ